ncbi:uncharacterized protein LOC121869786 isoform X2 [Homarus americanus]|uniref:uncharacterized protein LOC121869786 isoform X2 n=1 Tax=Homarus americanus TaxID=6706 RepID=UPI001C46C02F|nr:uncharacterized protein LOC121869786 isoform X2 [Homarus americanus]
MTRIKFNIWTPLLLIFGFVQLCECDVGDDCTGGGGFSCSFREKCVDGNCLCKEKLDLEYNKDTLTPSCNVKFGFRNPQKVLAACNPKSSNGVINSCDIEEYSLCENGLCICFAGYFANTTSGKCERQSSYLKAYGLTEYRVKPGEYCKDDGQCIPGLVCKSFKCSCPGSCSYNSKRESCDCGEVDTPNGPIIVGVIFGFIIIVFWIWRIKKTAETLKKKKATQFSTVLSNDDESPSQTSYPLRSVQSPFSAPFEATDAHPVPPGRFSVNPTFDGGRQSPIPTKKPEEQNPSPVAPYPPSEPGALPYPSPLPPPYSGVMPELPPPYSVDPPLMTGSPPSYPYNSTSMPTAPYPSSHSATPYSLNPSATPYPPPAAPNQETGSSTAPPAYNPTYSVNNP